MKDRLSFRLFAGVLFSLIFVAGIVFPSHAQLATVKTLIENCTTLYSTAVDRSHTIAVYPQSALSYYEYNTVSGTPPVATWHGDFVLNQNGTSIRTFPLPDNIYANDFYQVDSMDVIVFCGYINTSVSSPTQSGIIGWFNLNNYGNTVQISYVQIDDIYSFKKIRAKRNTSNNTCQLFAIGQQQKNENYHTAIYYLENFFGGISIAGFRVFNSHPQVQLSDITLTENFVSFIGFHSGYSSVCVQREFYSQMSSLTLPNLHNIYCFKLYDDGGVHSIRSTYLGNRLAPSGDMLCISTPTIIKSDSIHLVFRTIDLNGPASLCAQYVYTKEKMDVWDLTYVPNDGLVYAVFALNPLTGQAITPIVRIKPMVTMSYNTTAIVDNSHYFKKIDCLNLNKTQAKHIVSGNPYTWFLKDVTTATANDLCTTLSDIPVRDIKKPMIYLDNKDSSYYKYYTVIFSQRAKTTEYYDIDCIEFNR